MATVTTTTNNLRYTLGLRNGGSRYLDIENPITDTAVIASNVAALNNKVKPTGDYAGILVDEDFYNGDTDAVVVNVLKAETIQITKITETNSIFNS